MRIDEQDKVVDSRDNHLDDDPTLCGQSLHKQVVQLSSIPCA